MAVVIAITDGPIGFPDFAPNSKGYAKKLFAANQRLDNFLLPLTEISAGTYATLSEIEQIKPGARLNNMRLRYGGEFPHREFTFLLNNTWPADGIYILGPQDASANDGRFVSDPPKQGYIVHSIQDLKDLPNFIFPDGQAVFYQEGDTVRIYHYSANSSAPLNEPFVVETRTQTGRFIANLPENLVLLDETGKIPFSFMPEGTTGAWIYQTGWDASTNSPSIPAASSDNKGHYYDVVVAGDTNIDGETDWNVGDWIVSDGVKWHKLDRTPEPVTKETIGLGLVENFGMATYEQAIAGAITTAYMNPLRTKDLILDLFSNNAQNLTTGEIQQLANINSHAISEVQWGHLAGFDQGLATTDNVIFSQLSATLLTPNQPNITTLGTLLSLSVSGETILSSGDIDKTALRIQEQVNQTTTQAIFQIRNAGDTANFLAIYPEGNLSLGDITDFGAGKGILAIKDATTPPTVAPSGGSVLYSFGGRLHTRHGGAMVPVGVKEADSSDMSSGASGVYVSPQQLNGQKNIANGISSLDANTEVPIEQLPVGGANRLVKANGNGKIESSQIAWSGKDISLWATWKTDRPGQLLDYEPLYWVDTEATLDVSMGDFESAIVGDKFYFFGGYDGTNALDSIYMGSIYNPTVATLQSQVLPGPLYDSNLIDNGTHLFLIGGHDQNGPTSVIYSCSKDDPLSWSTFGTFAISAFGKRGVVYNGKAYIIGGYTGSGWGQCYSSDLSDMLSWPYYGSFWHSHGQLILTNNNLYHLSGYQNIYPNVLANNKYSNLSLMRPSQWTGDYINPYGNVRNQLLPQMNGFYLIGGEVGNFVPYNVIMKSTFDDPTNFSIVGSLPFNNSRSQTLTMGGRNYIYGGFDGTDYSNKILRSQPRPNFGIDLQEGGQLQEIGGHLFHVKPDGTQVQLS